MRRRAGERGAERAGGGGAGAAQGHVPPWGPPCQPERPRDRRGSPRQSTPRSASPNRGGSHAAATPSPGSAGGRRQSAPGRKTRSRPSRRTCADTCSASTARDGSEMHGLKREQRYRAMRAAGDSMRRGAAPLGGVHSVARDRPSGGRLGGSVQGASHLHVLWHLLLHESLRRLGLGALGNDDIQGDDLARGRPAPHRSAVRHARALEGRQPRGGACHHACQHRSGPSRRSCSSCQFV